MIKLQFTSAMVKELREKTNAGIMDCKTALQEAQGDMQKAVDYLRQKGLAVAQKRAGRSASEGMVHSYIHAGGKIGVMVEVNCETDFVAKDANFNAFADSVAANILQPGSADVDSLMGTALGDASVGDAREGIGAKMGEHI